MKIFLMALLSASTVFAQPPAEVLDLISRTYNPRVQVTESKDVSTFFDLCRRVEVTLSAQDPVTMRPGTVKLTTFVRKFSEAEAPTLKTVIVMPPTGGVNALDWSYAGFLCANGLRAAVVTNWDFDTFNELDMDMHDRGALRALAAIRHVVEFLKPQRPKQLGILGTSVGAISSTLALGYEARISAGALIVGGAGMPEIISSSNESHLAKLRQDRTAALKFKSVSDYEAALREHIKIEPMDFINLSGPKTVWMMIATKDDTVPTKNQWDLYRAFGSQPGSLTYEDNHLNTIVYTAATKTLAIVNYFKATLE